MKYLQLIGCIIWLANAQAQNAAMADSVQVLNEVVISGNLKPMSRAQSAVAIDVFKPEFFRANASAALIENFQYVNGVRSQVNCNVCNTADIRIQGMPGPYTMILVDGMPIVSGLATVYGLSGIPQSLIERIEIVKGPASTLYGSEAVGGVINIITKNAQTEPRVAAEFFGTSYGEVNTDASFRFHGKKKVQSMLGVNLFYSPIAWDKNGDNFTDVALQKRFSLFNKWHIPVGEKALLTLAARYVFENRWGGELQWEPKFYGTDSVYGEAITTQRWELFGTYRLATKEDIKIQFSLNGHSQHSAYGKLLFDATQSIGFAQAIWRKPIGTQHELLSGLSSRLTYYDDNTVATAQNESSITQNYPALTWLPGLFVQDEITLSNRQTVLLGSRLDYHSEHGIIISPRVNYMVQSKSKRHVLRVGIGNGYRVASVFTEDHAALTGAREVVFAEQLNPETSWNANLNYSVSLLAGRTFFRVEAGLFYTYFINRILPDYDTDPNKIVYANLEGYAVNRGAAVNVAVTLPFGLTADVGVTAVDASIVTNDTRETPYFTETFSAVYKVQYPFERIGLVIDLTGNVIGPMRLPLLGELDPRPEYAPWWGNQNVQFTKMLHHGWQIFGGVKNLLNYLPPANSIARAHDPFDKQVTFDAQGNVVPTINNPFALTFDPSYAFAPNQGIRFFIGVRFHFD